MAELFGDPVAVRLTDATAEQKLEIDTKIKMELEGTNTQTTTNKPLE